MKQDITFSYRSMRTFIGVIALLIPVACVALLVFDQGELLVPLSISVTYHLGARDVFVGMLFIVGSFLMAYNGHRLETDTFYVEWLLAKCAGLSAFLVALYPTSFDMKWILQYGLSPRSHECILPTLDAFVSDPDLVRMCHVGGNEHFADIHLLSAVLLIFILFVFCVRFLLRAKEKLKRIMDKENYSEQLDGVQGDGVRRRIATYYICSAGMVVTVIAGAVYNIYGPEYNASTFWVEWFCLWFFGWSWLTAGKQIKLYSEGSLAEDYLSQQLDEVGSVKKVG